MTALRLRSLPRNATDVTRVLACVDGTVKNLPLSSDVGSVRLRVPRRSVSSSPGRVNATTRACIGQAQIADMSILSHSSNVSTCCRQTSRPTSLRSRPSRWRCCGHETRAAITTTYRTSSFGFLAATAGWSTFGLRSEVERNAEQFALTRKACDEIGWQYDVFTGLASEHAHNLRWLAGYRHDRNAPTTSTAELIRDCFERPLPLQRGSPPYQRRDVSEHRPPDGQRSAPDMAADSC